MNFSHKYKGFKPNALKSKLDITEGKLRAWRKALDPRADKSSFSGRDLLMYGIFRMFMVAKRVPLRVLKQFDWGPIFQRCYRQSLSELMTCAVVYDSFDENMYFTKRCECVNISDPYIQCIKFTDVINHIDKTSYNLDIDLQGKPKDNITNLFAVKR